MSFLAPWALIAGALGALGVVLLHLVAWQRPAAYVLPTTRFIPDQRTVVSRAATRPRDALLLLLRVLSILAAAVAFARPVLAPSRGSRGTIILVDRSAHADSASVAARAQQIGAADASATTIEFDGSLSAAFVMARRAGAAMSEHVDSVRLVLVSPLARSEYDSATAWLRAQWPGGMTVERVPMRRDTLIAPRVAATLGADDPLAPALRPLIAAAAPSRVVRGALSAADSSAARSGGTIVHWPAWTAQTSPRGVVVGDEVIVANLGQRVLPQGARVVAQWSTGEPAAVELSVGAGCVREVGIGVSSIGDLPLHAPFQRAVRTLVQPCGAHGKDLPLDSATVTSLLGGPSAAAADALRGTNVPPTPLVKWLLAIALCCAVLELVARRQAQPAVPA